jgi:glycosyltransferase involved in cell wall biosynthesis
MEEYEPKRASMNSKRANKGSAVVFSDRNPSRSNGGEELVLREALLGLAARGWRCLLAYHEWGDLIPEYEAAGIGCRRFDLTAVRLQNPWRFASSVTQQVLWARRQGVGLYHCNSYFRAAHAAAVKHLGGVPAICHFHIPPPEYLSRQYRWGLKQLDEFVAVSRCTAAEWSQALSVPQERVAVLHNPIDTTRFRPDPDARKSARGELGVADDCIVIGFCGRLIEEKGPDVLIRAAARLVAQHQPIKLLILGSDAQNIILHGRPFEPTLRRLARELGIADRVNFLGGRHDVERWYNAADLMTAPSLFSDSFGLVVAEALACGRPVIASRIGGIPEIMSGPLDEFLVPPNDIDALAVALHRLISDPERRAQVGRIGQEIVAKNFGVGLFLDRLEQIFTRTLTSDQSYQAAAA